MKINLQPKYALTILGAAAFLAVSIAWAGNPQSPKQTIQDTVPKTKSAKTPDQSKKDFEKELNQLDQAMKNLENVPNIDLEKMKAEIEQSLKQVQTEMERHKIDMDKMKEELNASLSKINLEKMNEELRQSMKELDKLDVAKMKADMQQSLRELDKIDMEKMKKEMAQAMDEVKKIDMEKVRQELEKARQELEQNKEHMKIDMQKAREDIKKAKEELKAYKELVESLENDGLINTKEDYTIEYKDGDLLINGKKQSEEVVNKYKKYFKKGNLTIRKEKGEMNINIQ